MVTATAKHELFIFLTRSDGAVNPKYKRGHTLVRILIPHSSRSVLTGFCISHHSLFLFLCFCHALLMKCITRQSLALAGGENSHTPSQLSENGDPLQVPMNTSRRGKGRRQKGANLARFTANPPGESDILLSFSPL